MFLKLAREQWCRSVEVDVKGNRRGHGWIQGCRSRWAPWAAWGDVGMGACCGLSSALLGWLMNLRMGHLHEQRQQCSYAALSLAGVCWAIDAARLE